LIAFRADKEAQVIIEISVEQAGDIDIVTINGRVDSRTAPEMGDCLSHQIDQGSLYLVINFNSVDYMSSAGLRELVSALKRVKSAGGDIRLCCVPPRVNEVLELSGLSSIFYVFEDQSSALESFSA
jgi:anti-sigma B factor antagonist